MSVPLKRCPKCGELKLATTEFFYVCKARQQSKRLSDGPALLATCKACLLASKKVVGFIPPITQPDSSLLKKCTQCGEEKLATVENFGLIGVRKNLDSRCRPCKAAYMAARQFVIVEDAATLKRCNKCHQDKPATRGYFHASTGLKGGLAGKCIECRREETNREEVRARRIEHHKERYQDPVVAQAAKEKTRIWRERQIAELGGDAFRKRKNQFTKEQKAKNPIHTRAKVLEHANNYRVRELAAEGSHTAEEIMALLDSQRRRCAYCQRDMGMAWTEDHVIPLSRGGTNWISNIALACRSCNSAKHNKLLVEWVNRWYE